jgi:DNA helicase-2/ATP-dependent DNA helicase PcrA
VALERIINTPSRKIGKTTIGKLHEYAREHQISLYELIKHIDTSPVGITKTATQSLKQFGHLLAFWTAGLEEMSVSDLITKIINDIRYQDHLRKEYSEAEAQERYDNIGQLINFANKVEHKGLQGIEDFLDEVSLLSDPAEADGGELDAVKLMTIHASKGLEFSMVNIVGCEENIFPMARASMDSDELEEERRLMYVAITRAENHLILSRAVSRMHRGQTQYNPPSRFFKELPEELVSMYDFSDTSGSHSGATASPLTKGDEVIHKIFGRGYIVELRGNSAIIKFDQAQYGIRKIDVHKLARG